MNPVRVMAVAILVAGCAAPSNPRRSAGPGIDSLEQLSINTLRQRSYGSTVEFAKLLGRADQDTPYSRHFSADGSAPYSSFMTSYRSDGLRVYARVDIPAASMPARGYPIVVFLHGWVGIENAPTTDFYYSVDSYYADWVDRYVDAGFVVITPGYRGHGTVDGVAAEGIDYMSAWDNGSYLSPMFYAIDVLNLLEGLDSLEQIEWQRWDPATAPALRIDRGQINIASHSQGGDVALTVLAATGEQAAAKTTINAASIWAGTFAPRVTQLETYYAMQKSPQAFMSGDGSWTGSAIGADGSVNPNFVFAWPPDWIGTLDTAQWTWQSETWNLPSVAAAVEVKLQEMYNAINQHVGDIDGASYELSSAANGKLTVDHDQRVNAALENIDAYRMTHYLTEPLVLQHSDQDLYSLPSWNAGLCVRIVAAGGQCVDFTYQHSNHALKKSEHAWFSPPGSVAGFDYAIKRDIALFGGHDPARIAFP